MDVIAARRKRTAFAIVFVVFFGIVILALLWATGVL
jgi:hypothetical protein